VQGIIIIYKKKENHKLGTRYFYTTE